MGAALSTAFAAPPSRAFSSASSQKQHCLFLVPTLVLIPCCGVDPDFREIADVLCSICQGKRLLSFFPEVSNCLLIFQHIKSIIMIVPDMCWLCQGLRKTKKQ